MTRSRYLRILGQKAKFEDFRGKFPRWHQFFWNLHQKIIWKPLRNRLYIKKSTKVNEILHYRHLFERCENEHLNLRSSQKSEIKDHLRTCGECQKYQLNYSNFQILRHCRNETYCKFFEAFAIKRFNPTLNKQMFAQGASKFLHVWK